MKGTTPKEILAEIREIFKPVRELLEKHPHLVTFEISQDKDGIINHPYVRVNIDIEEVEKIIEQNKKQNEPKTS